MEKKLSSCNLQSVCMKKQLNYNKMCIKRSSSERKEFVFSGVFRFSCSRLNKCNASVVNSSPSGVMTPRCLTTVHRCYISRQHQCDFESLWVIQAQPMHLDHRENTSCVLFSQPMLCFHSITRCHYPW